jgi:PAS domain S-box-containing protein
VLGLDSDRDVLCGFRKEWSLPPPRSARTIGIAMKSSEHVPPARDSARARALFEEQWRINAARTDRMFAVLMLLQWAAAIAVALLLSPQAWEGGVAAVHPHVWAALIYGGVLAALPVGLAWKQPGRASTRYVIGVAQVIFSSLLIHVTGGRIETHFHVFGSLAFLAFYRDWRVLIPATLVVAGDHFVRGVWWPQTVFGLADVESWRWLEHAGWVVFEDVFLILACRSGEREMRDGARRTAELEQLNREMRRQADDLEAAYHFQNAVVETSLDAVVTMNDEGRITRWNSQAEIIFGRPSSQVLGKPLAEVIIPERFRAAHVEGLATYLRTGVGSILNRRLEVSALAGDGREFPIEISIAPIRSGESVGFCAFVRDITVRHQAEEALRSAKVAAEDANAAKSAFLANMSHEIRTPLNGIIGFTDLLLIGDEPLPAQHRDHVETIHDCGRHLLTLINDVLDLSKIESGQLEVERVRCSPHQIIAEAISVLRVRAQERGLDLEYFWKSEIPDTIETDPTRLRQIVMNLVGNSLKFTEVGSVQVAARIEDPASPRLVIDVIDTGVGIPAEALSRIFDPFVQADNSITRRFGGTGLGLSISRRLAVALGGDITVESTPGRGSTFTVSVATGPLEGVVMRRGIASDLVVATRPAAAGNLPPCRILLVEDGATNRKLIGLILERAGARVRTAENGQAGVEAAALESFDVVLMDMQMPVMDGYSAARELRRRGFTRPIVALTAHAMTGDERKCREAGCSGYLTKPIKPERLLETVAEALAARTDMPPGLTPDSTLHDAAPAAPAPATTPPAARHLAAPTDSSHDETPIESSLPMDDPEFREIVREFAERVDVQLAQLRDAVSRGDLKSVAEIAHWIKGSGGTVGFDLLTRPAAALERHAVEGSPEMVVVQLKALEGLVSRIAVPIQ